MTTQSYAEISCSKCGCKFPQIHDTLRGVRKIAKNCNWQYRLIDNPNDDTTCHYEDICPNCNKVCAND